MFRAIIDTRTRAGYLLLIPMFANRVFVLSLSSRAGKLRPDQVEELRVVFNDLDDDKSGAIDAGELEEVFKAQGQALPRHEIEQMIEQAWCLCAPKLRRSNQPCECSACFCSWLSAVIAHRACMSSRAAQAACFGGLPCILPHSSTLDRLPVLATVQIDTDGNGTVEFDEFCELMAANLQETDLTEEFVRAFAERDSNKTGFCSKSELRRVLPIASHVDP